MAFTEDPTVFINADTPGYMLATINSIPVGALWDSEYAAAFGIDGAAPSLLVKSVDVSVTARGQTVVAGGVNYTVQGIQPDGTGFTRILLERA